VANPGQGAGFQQIDTGYLERSLDKWYVVPAGLFIIGSAVWLLLDGVRRRREVGESIWKDSLLLMATFNLAVLGLLLVAGGIAGMLGYID
jgi:hypothetical protein